MIITTIKSTPFRKLNDSELFAFELEDYQIAGAGNFPEYQYNALKDAIADQSGSFMIMLWVLGVFVFIFVVWMLIFRMSFLDCLIFILIFAVVGIVGGIPYIVRVYEELYYAQKIRAGEFQFAVVKITDKNIGHHTSTHDNEHGPSETRIIKDYYVYFNDVQCQYDKAFYKTHKKGEELILVLCNRTIVGISEYNPY